MNLLYGQIGHFLVLLSFISAIVATVSFYIASGSKSTIEQRTSWKRLGLISFIIHGLSIVSIFGVLFLMIIGHHFEYQYVWQHSSLELPTRYLLSCFWEGQEGSFLLWAFWHVVLGLILATRNTDYSKPVMTVISFVQVFLSSMLLGLYFGDFHIGSSPFLLLRDTMPEAPIFSMNPDYIPEDGTGLNPLLQNYWMTIHPPTLFLGFASTVVPFAFAIAALWKKQYAKWALKALPWTLFSAMILGTGIMMGAAWAYEALSFGGFWAWDPVENASLVPWLTLIAGLHTLVIFKATKHALKATFVFFIITFFLILYSTFLTRSGILGDTSVHAFTDLGMSGQLIIYMAALIIPAIYLLVSRWTNVPAPKTEESTYSREFWMFIGSLVLCISAVQITFSTSIPVINKIFGSNLAPPVEAIAHYNKWQLPLAIIVALLTAITQFFQYRKTNISNTWKRVLPTFVLSILLTIFIAWHFKFEHFYYDLFTFCATYGVLGNLYFIISSLSGKIKLAGGSISHIGFGLMLLGILISNAEQEVISLNNIGMDFGKNFDAESNRENILLTKGTPTQMNDYTVTYVSDSTVGPNTYFKINYLRGKETFTLYPNVQLNERMGDVANPDTRHYFSKDVYTHITAMKQKKTDNKPEKITHILSLGDTITLNRCFAVLTNVIVDAKDLYDSQVGDIAIAANLKVFTIDSTYSLQPVYYIRGNHATIIPKKLEEAALTVQLNKIYPERQEFEIITEQEDTTADYIIMKAIVFPFINILWIGLIVMILGFCTSIYRRITEKRKIE